MVFSSLSFICVFLPVVFILHTVIKPIPAKNALLIVASLAFYAYGEPIYVLLMLASTIINWALGVAIGKRQQACMLQKEGIPAKHAKASHASSAATAGRAWLIVAVVVNLVFLGIFKYAGMVIASLDGIFGLHLPLPEIALPIGISFYTFQALSYVVDVYRGHVQACSNYARVLLYISFFPQLIAGPIVKYHDVAEQLAQRYATLEDIACGLRRFCVGLSKKVLIANTVAVVADSIFAAPLSSINIAGAWIGSIAYMLQIYFDFSGYSDMAIGMARMFGFHFKENFQYPYATSSLKEFWRRWHISLSTWLKEYVYIPLGGNRKGRTRTVINKLVVFFLCGLWHGAAWTFVVWGLIHGLFLLLEEYLPIHKLPRPLGIIYTLIVVCVAFVLFRAESFEQGGIIIAQMFTGFHFEFSCVELAMRQLSPLLVITLPVAVLAATPLGNIVTRRLSASSGQSSAHWRTLSFIGAFVLLALCLLTLSGGGYNPFIYFRF